MLEADMLKVPWGHFDACYQSRCIPLQQYSLGLLIDNKQILQTILSYSQIQSHKSEAGINNPSTKTHQEQWSDVKTNSQTERRQKKKLTAAFQKKYLSVDKLHLQQTQMVKDTISAFDPPLAQSNSPNKKALWLLQISVKGHGLLSGKQNTVQSHVYCSSYSLFPYDK